MNTIVGASSRALLYRRMGRYLTNLILLGVAFFWVYPFMWMVSTAVKTQREVVKSRELCPCVGPSAL
jgi:ABC-type glycerol-3-phosphate transport system permease component